MATHFVRVTDPYVLFDLWSEGLLYNNDGSLMHCPYALGCTPEEIAKHRIRCIEDWQEGVGITFGEHYGYILEE